MFCGRKDNPCVHICSNQHATFTAPKHSFISSCAVTAKRYSCSLLAGIVFHVTCNPVPYHMEQGYILVIIQQKVCQCSFRGLKALAESFPNRFYFILQEFILLIMEMTKQTHHGSFGLTKTLTYTALSLHFHTKHVARNANVATNPCCIVLPKRRAV